MKKNSAGHQQEPSEARLSRAGPGGRLYVTIFGISLGPWYESWYHLIFITAGPRLKLCAGGGAKRGDVFYRMLRAAAVVDESDHHALMYVRQGQMVKEEGVDERSARRL